MWIWPWLQIVIWSGLVMKSASFCFHQVLTHCERRPAHTMVQLKDPVLACLPRIDTTYGINLLQHSLHLLYLPNLLYLVVGCSEAQPFATTALAFILLILMRSLSVFVTPLEVPYGHIHLQDWVQNLTFGYRVDDPSFDRDLFFSGHVSVLCLGGWTYQLWPQLRPVYLAAALVQALQLLLCRVHYTIDVVLAPFMSYGCWQLAQYLLGVDP